jgi:hypothetical protein
MSGHKPCEFVSLGAFVLGAFNCPGPNWVSLGLACAALAVWFV